MGKSIRNIDDDISTLWETLWNSKMIGVIRHTDKTGREKVRYFVNEHGQHIFTLLIERYKLSGIEQLSDFVGNEEKSKILVICRFCGHKTEQGLEKCKDCGADL